MFSFSNANGAFATRPPGRRRIVNPAAPQPAAAPTVDAPPVAGRTVTADPGAWTNAPTGFLYQWMANGLPIAGANGRSFMPAQAQVGAPLAVAVTAVNDRGAEVALARAGTVAVAAAPARLPLHARLVGLGDSIVAGSNGQSILTVGTAFAGGRFYVPPGGNQGVGGSTTAQLLSRTASQDGSLAKALTLAPKVLHLHCGTNDIVMLNAPAADITARLRQIVDRAKAADVHVVVDTILPRADGSWTSTVGIGQAERESRRRAVNAWIMALDEPGVTPVDLDAVGFNPASADTVDLLHPSRPGAWGKIGPALGYALAGVVSASSVLYADPADHSNLLSFAGMAGVDGALSGAGVSGQVASGWSAGTTITGAGLAIAASKEVDAEGFARQVLAFSGTPPSNGSVLISRSQPFTGIAGESYDFWCHAEWSGLSGVRAFFMKGAGTADFEGNTGYADPPANYSGPIRNLASTLAANATTSPIQFGFYVGAGIPISGTLKISRPTWRKVPPGQ